MGKENSRSKGSVMILAMLFIASLIDALDASIVNVALPTIATNFGVTMANSTWVILGYALPLAALLIPVGKFSKNGRVKKFFIVGTAILITGSVACGLSGTFASMAVFRIVQGVGAAMMSAAMPSILVRLLPEDMKGAGMAAMGGGSGIALICGPTVGGLLIGVLSWHWIFFINVPIGIGLIIMASKLIPADSGTDRSKDPSAIGSVSIFLVIGLILMLMQNFSDHDLPTEAVAAAFVVLAAALVLLVRNIRGDPDRAVVSQKMLFNRDYAVLCAAFMLSTMMLAGTHYVLPYWLQISYGMDSVQTGMFLTIPSVAMLLTVFAVGRLVDRRGGKSSSIAAQLCRILLCAIMIIVVPPEGLPLMAAAMVFMGFSQSFSGTGHTTRIIHSSTPGYEDDSTNFMLVVNYVAVAVGAVLYSLTISLTVPGASGASIQEFTADMMNAAVNNVAVLGIAFLVAALVMSAVIPNRIPKKEPKD